MLVDKLVSVLHLANAESRLHVPNPNSTWEGIVGISPCSDQQAVQTLMFTSFKFKPTEKLPDFAACSKKPFIEPQSQECLLTLLIIFTLTVLQNRTLTT